MTNQRYDIHVCDEHFDPELAEYTSSLAMLGIKCEYCGKPATHHCPYRDDYLRKHPLPEKEDSANGTLPD